MISQEQYNLIFPNSNQTDSKKFDATLLNLQIQSLWFKKPKIGWKNIPVNNDNSDSAHLVRLRRGRNVMQHHPEIVSETDFNNIYTKLRKPLQAFGCTPVEINDTLACDLQNHRISYKRSLAIATVCSIVVAASIFMHRYIFERPYGMSFKVLPPSSSFFGRESTLTDLHSLLSNKYDGNIGTVITGLGGIGKGQLAKKYCQMYSEFYHKNIVWIDGRSNQSMAEAF